jgi:ABC-2 type transport system permease protein
MKKSLFTVLTFARINTKRFFRDKVALFFGVGFPLIFLFVFGNLYSSNSNVSFRVALINQSDSTIAKQFSDELSKSEIIKVNKDITNIDAAKEKMNLSELDAAIVLPDNFGDTQQGAKYPSGQAEVVYTQNNQQSATALSSILDVQFKEINKKFIQDSALFSVKSTQLNEKSLSSFDYSFAGLLGFSILGIGIFGPINIFPELKKMGILRRLSTTPIRVWQYFLSTMIGQVAIGSISFIAMFAVAVAFFDLQVVGNWFELAVFLTLSVIMMLGIGLALGGWAKNERQVAPMSNIITFPMMFLSGTFFPRFLMPEWLQNVSAFLPLTPVIEGVRLITTEAKGLLDILPQIGIVGAWTVVIYLIAFKVFRWE